jgi:hypothetical protein
MRPSRLLSSISVTAVTLILLACGQPGYPVATYTPTLGAQQLSTRVTQLQRITRAHDWILVTYTAAIPYADRPGVAELKVSAGCRPGERMVGAGYAATSVFEYNASITTSYPTDDHTWVATGGAQAGLQLDVYCLHGDHLPTVVITSTTSGAVMCPANSVLLAKGFGRSVTGATTRPTYALCATTGVKVGTTATASVTFDSIHHGFMPVDASVNCPAGQMAFGGGTIGVSNFASGASADFTSWDITGGGQGSGTVYADCVQLI